MDRIARLCSVGFLLVAAWPASADQPIAVDRAGKLIGAVIRDGVVAYPLKPSAGLVEIGISAGAIGTTPFVTFFATPNCSGPIYIPRYGVIPRAYLDPGHDDTIIYADLTAPPVRVRSFKETGSPDCQQRSVDQPATAYPVKSVGVARQNLLPPFAVKAD